MNAYQSVDKGARAAIPKSVSETPPRRHHRHIVWLGGVATEDAVRAEQPEVTRLRDGLFGQGRDVIGVRQATLVGERVEQLLEVAVVEAEEFEVGPGDAQLSEGAARSSSSQTPH